MILTKSCKSLNDAIYVAAQIMFLRKRAQNHNRVAWTKHRKCPYKMDVRKEKCKARSVCVCECITCMPVNIMRIFVTGTVYVCNYRAIGVCVCNSKAVHLVISRNRSSRIRFCISDIEQWFYGLYVYWGNGVTSCTPHKKSSTCDNIEMIIIYTKLNGRIGNVGQIYDILLVFKLTFKYLSCD